MPNESTAEGKIYIYATFKINTDTCLETRVLAFPSGAGVFHAKKKIVENGKTRVEIRMEKRRREVHSALAVVSNLILESDLILDTRDPD